MIDYIDPTHGIIMAAIGAALFASLLVAWLWGRVRARRTWRRRTAAADCVLHDSWASIGTNTITEGPQFGKPAPYAPITGTGSRPEAPWVTREELDAAEQRVNDGLDDLAARLEALESKRGGEGWRAFRRIECGSVGVETEDGAAYLYDAQNGWRLFSGKGSSWFSSHKDSWYTELHGPERARIVREFLDWKGAQ